MGRGRVWKHFDKGGNPSETLIKAKQERLDNWRTLRELAGIFSGDSAYSCTESGLDKLQALKEMPPSLATDYEKKSRRRKKLRWISSFGICSAK